MSGSGPAPSLVPVVPTLIWDSVPADSALALFLVPVVPILLWEPISVISGSGGFDPDSVFGSGGSGSAVVLGSDSVSAVPALLWDLVPAISGSGGSDSVMGPSFDSVFGSGSDSVTVSGSGGSDPVVGLGFDSDNGPGGSGSIMGPNSALVSGSDGSDPVIGLCFDFGILGLVSMSTLWP